MRSCALCPRLVDPPRPGIYKWLCRACEAAAREAGRQEAEADRQRRLGYDDRRRS